MEFRGNQGSQGHNNRVLLSDYETQGLPDLNLEFSLGPPGQVNQTSNNNSTESSVRDQPRHLPVANVGRLMRQILPPHAKLSNDSKATMQECVSEFISFITSEANEHRKNADRKSLMGEDLITAMQSVGMDNYVEPLRLYLQRYRESVEAAHRARGRSNESSSGAGSSQGSQAKANE